MSLTDTIIQYKKENILVICFNKPKKKNALDSNMYQEVKEIFQKATTDDEIAAVVITGTGNFYSSGNDLSYIPKTDEEYLEFMKVLRNFIRAFIVFPKILIALVNGPAVGIAATSLPLCDLVLASDNSYFSTPFTKLGFVAEGCSTLTFPRIMGDRKALEMLLFNYKLSAKEALECGFINYVYKHDEFQIKAWDKIKEITELPTIPMFATKKLIRHQIQEQLLKINDKELQKIIQIKTNRLMKFENENSKL
ncbi:enoyl-CoA delta isomerase 2-like isoform X1 [Achroia grisella]|uniref:enoyl-CoA delta isomerase 2-like isoform X1 n=1 Tax=Achroia grisella TaxID=688607 RepID=UPI0027D2E56E|nr:enoyl-CoA delta isomerase 2-like isoform X1 [Achroia grisella]